MGRGRGKGRVRRGGWREGKKWGWFFPGGCDGGRGRGWAMAGVGVGARVEIGGAAEGEKTGEKLAKRGKKGRGAVWV
jgi:hypothetical protein